MKKLEMFMKGRHIAASGQALEFTEDHLQASVKAYDPKLHEAPIVIGHPQDDAPAYGWIKSIEYGEDGKLYGNADQVEVEFEEMVKSGRFKKRSASFYHPNSAKNPVPGVYYLRHLGFLGAQPPAVKGLADPEFKEGKVPDSVEFNDSADDYIEFADTAVVATIFRRFREFLVDKFGMEEADRIAPSFLIEDLEDESRREMDSEVDPSYSEDPSQQPTGDQSMLTDEQIKDLQAKAAKADKLQEENDSLKSQASDFAERERKLARAEIEKSVDALIDEGKVRPADREREVNFLESLDDENQEAVSFTEGEGNKAKTHKMSQRAAYLENLENRPPIVDFEEHSGEGASEETADFAEIAEEAKAYRASQRKAGRNISASQAVKAVQAGKHKQQ